MWLVCVCSFLALSSAHRGLLSRPSASVLAGFAVSQSCPVAPELFQVSSSKFSNACLDASAKRLALRQCDPNSPTQSWRAIPTAEGVQLMSGGRCLSSSSLTLGPCSGAVKLHRHVAAFMFDLQGKCVNAKTGNRLNLVNCNAKFRKQHFFMAPVIDTAAEQQEYSRTEHEFLTSDGQKVVGVLDVPKGAKANTPAIVIAADGSHVDELELSWAKSLSQKNGWIVLSTSPWTVEEAAAVKAGEMSRMILVRKYTTDLPLVATRFRSIIDWLKGHRFVDSTRIAGAGFCLGGHNMLELANLNVPGVVGVVSIHGFFAPGSKSPARINAKVLVLHGADDQKEDLVDNIAARLDAAKAVFETTKFANVVHSYTNPNAGYDASSGSAYNPYAADRAYRSTEHFFLDVFTPGGAPYQYQVSEADRAKLVEEVVSYQDGEDELFGYVYYLKDGGNDQKPGVVVSHAWGGLHEHEKNVAQRLALQGYIGFAHSVFTKNEAQQAGGYNFMAKIQVVSKYSSDIPLYSGRMKAALDFLKSHDKVDATRLAVGGYCFGGGSSLVTLNLNDPAVLGVASFHGSLNINMKSIENPTARVLVLHGNDDDNINDGPRGDNSMVQSEFEKVMNDNNMNWELTKYASTGHGFTEPSSVDYNILADRRSFKTYLDFLEKLFAPRVCFANKCSAAASEAFQNQSCSCGSGCRSTNSCCDNFFEDCLYYSN